VAGSDHNQARISEEVIMNKIFAYFFSVGEFLEWHLEVSGGGFLPV